MRLGRRGSVGPKGSIRPVVKIGSYADDRRAVHGVVRQILERPSACSNGYSIVVGRIGIVCGQGEELLAVPPGIGSYAYDFTFFEQMSLVLEEGMSDRWMPAMARRPPRSSAARAGGTSVPTGANRMAASSGSGVDRRPLGPRRTRGRGPAHGPRRPCHDVHGGAWWRATWAVRWAEPPKP